MNKKIIITTVLLSACGWLIWQFLTPVEIVAAYRENRCSKMYDCHSDILLVRNFPYLKNRQVAWWETNKDMIKAKYGIPSLHVDGYYSVNIMGFGDGYRIDHGTDEDSDLLCFYEMNAEARCVEKNNLLWVGWSKNKGQSYR